MILQTAGLEGASAVGFLLARVLFGAVLAFTGLNHFLQREGMADYASAKGVPAAGALVPLSGAVLVLGGLSIVLGAFPLVGAGALAAFLLVTTPVMHDFWNAGPEEQQTEMTQFLKNVALLGGALAFLALATVEWPLAVGAGVV